MLRRMQDRRERRELESRLFASRPVPPENLVADIHARIERPARRRPRLAAALALTGAIVIALAATGSFGYAASSLKKAVHVFVKVGSPKSHRTPSLGGTAASNQYLLPPTIDSLQPYQGKVGTTVKILGSHFTGTTRVRFNGAAAAFTFVSDTRLLTSVPAGAVTGRVEVANPEGSALSPQPFTVIVAPEILNFSPTSGVIGKQVTINGRHFAGTTRVLFHGISASFTIVSNKTVVATVPAGATTGRIKLSNQAGEATSPSDFTVILPPSISYFSPTSGPVGANVTIIGQNFAGTNKVLFRGGSATFTVVTNTKITATVPADGRSGHITVKNPAGSDTSTTTFTITP
jgi:hypothetical protein